MFGFAFRPWIILSINQRTNEEIWIIKYEDGAQSSLPRPSPSLRRMRKKKKKDEENKVEKEKENDERAKIKRRQISH